MFALTTGVLVFTVLVVFARDDAVPMDRQLKQNASIAAFAALVLALILYT